MHVAEIYPWSRIKIRSCAFCKGEQGRLVVVGVVRLAGVERGDADLLQVSCDWCGHTMLFDQTVMERRPMPEGAELGPRLGGL